MWYRIQAQQVTIQLLVKPNAKKTAVLAIDAQGLHLALHAQPIEGEANKVLVDYLARQLKLPKKAVQLQRGEHSRKKQISLPLTDTVQRWIENPLSPIR